MTDETPREFSADEKNVIQALLDAAIRADFPENPKIDKNGKPKFDKLDEKLRFKPYNDIGNAERLIERFGDDLLYVENIGWYGWTGKHWSLEDGLRQAERRAQETAKGLKREALAVIAAGPAPDEDLAKAFPERCIKARKFANASGNIPRLNAMLEAAQTHLAVAHDALDTKQWLVTTETGTLCLDQPPHPEKKGLVEKRHDPKDKISKKIPVKYDPEAECPKFMKFLSEIQPDVETQLFLQRWFGYSLTGSTSEQAILMFFGGGSNGKSALMGLMNYIFGDYAQNIPIASLMAQDRKSGSGATPDLARLPAARFVTASEPDAGERFSESLLKLVSGGEKMTVRHLNQGFFEFTPQFKLCISFNNKPSVRGSDDGFWRRVMLVPFEQQFKSKEVLHLFPGAKPKNPDLENELKAEASGILNWMLDGFLLWREKGLQVPEKIRAATAEYRAETNHVLEFITGCCDVQKELHISSTALYDAYAAWAKDNATEAHSKKLFGVKVAEYPGVKRQRAAVTNYYHGIGLKPEFAAGLVNMKRGEEPPPHPGYAEGEVTV